MTDRLVFVGSITALTFIYTFVFSATGGALFDHHQQRRLGALVPALGLLVLLPWLVVSVLWVPPSLVLGLVVATIGFLWLRVLRRVGTRSVVAGLAMAARHAVLLAV